MEKFTLCINDTTCIKCGKCVKVCPAHLFVFESDISNGKGRVIVSNINDCIKCGHCAAVCPTGAVEHSYFPAAKVHKIDYTQYPTPDQIELICKSRRSNRAFNGKPVPQEFLNRIIEAAHRAPTASNLQQVEFTLISNPQVLHQISEYTLNVFSKIEKKLMNPILKPILKLAIPQAYRYVPKFKIMRKEFAKGNDLILRGATAVIFIHTPKENRFGDADSNLAYQNGSLMAESLGVSQFYTGFVCTAIKQDKENKLSTMLGISGTIHAGMALGMTDFKYPNYIDKEELKVKMIL
ncbi:MAG: nitroreductase family protein [Bacteroidales bacterium]